MFGCGIGSGWSSWMIIPMMFRFIIIIAVIYFGVKLFRSHVTNNNHAIKLLDEKFAIGEINEEEYVKRKSILRR